MKTILILAVITAAHMGFMANGLACAPAPPPGYSVEIDDEEVLIVWDAENQTQHFIRRMNFRTDAPDFGFLVPTPTTPTLAEFPGEVFQSLNATIQPKIVYQKERRFQPTLSFLMFLSGPSQPRDTLKSTGVRVLKQQRVAGFDAAVLEADSADALYDWLKARSYPIRPALKEWFKPYIEKKWKITAFKVAKTDKTVGTTVATDAVRMSFKTPMAFHPYREPRPKSEKAKATGTRGFRMYVIAKGRVDGTIGQSPNRTVPWRPKLLYAAPLANVKELLAKALPNVSLNTPLWLSAFHDSNSPRLGTDELYFSLASNTKTYLPKPRVVYDYHTIQLPIDLMLLFFGVPAFVVWRRKRRRRISS